MGSINYIIIINSEAEECVGPYIYQNNVLNMEQEWLIQKQLTRLKEKN